MPIHICTLVITYTQERDMHTQSHNMYYHIVLHKYKHTCTINRHTHMYYHTVLHKHKHTCTIIQYYYTHTHNMYYHTVLHTQTHTHMYYQQTHTHCTLTSPHYHNQINTQEEALHELLLTATDCTHTQN